MAASDSAVVAHARRNRGMELDGAVVIVNVSSMTSRMVLPGVGGYSATKSALNMLSQVARRELAPDGIVVSLVNPSVTATEFHHSLRAGARIGGDAWAVTPHPADRVAEAIVDVIRSGEEEVMLGHDGGWNR